MNDFIHELWDNSYCHNTTEIQNDNPFYQDYVDYIKNSNGTFGNTLYKRNMINGTYCNTLVWKSCGFE